MASRPPFLAWPGWSLLGVALLLSLAQTLWWILIYHGANYLTGLHTFRVPLHMQWELGIPFVPVFILAYLSLGLVFTPAPFILRSREELRALTLTLFLVTAVAGVGFLLVPGEAAYAPADPGIWSDLFDFNRRVVLRYNMAPSLHVALSCVVLAAYAARCRWAGKLFLASWAGLIALATLLTHQHHLVDLISGLALAWAGFRFCYRPLAGRAATALTHSANRCPDPGPPV